MQPCFCFEITGSTSLFLFVSPFSSRPFHERGISIFLCRLEYTMLCACSGEQFKFEEMPQSPESLAARDFSASVMSSSRTVDWESRMDDSQVEEAESTLKEALSLNYEEARALLGRLEFQRGNFDGALQVFQGIDVRGLAPKMTKVIAERTQQRKGRFKGENSQTNTMSMHSVSLLLEAILLKAKSLEELGRVKEAAKECKVILDTVEPALPNGMPGGIFDDCKLQEMFHRALELLPKLWKEAGLIEEAVTAYRRALIKPWSLDSHRLASVQKDLAAMLLYSGVEVTLPSHLQAWASLAPTNNIEEAILLLFILIRKIACREIAWDPEIMDHLTFALSMSGQFEILANHFEQALPGIYNRAERWYLLALCYSATCQNEVALNLLEKALGCSERQGYLPSLLLAAKLCSQDPKHSREGLEFARRAIEFTSHQAKHFRGISHHLLGVCYGNCARFSVSDTERTDLQSESLKMLQHAATLIGEENPEVIFSLGLENAVQRNLNAALENTKSYLDMVTGSSAKGWRLLALVVSAEKCFKDAETIVDIALDETGKEEHFDLLRLKAVLQITRGHPTQAIETYRILLGLLQEKRQSQAGSFGTKVDFGNNIELEAWQDLADIYIKLGLLSDANLCMVKAKLIKFYSPKNWHAAGKLFEAKSLYKDALVAFSVALTIEPDHVPSMISAAVVLRQLGERTLPVAGSFLMNALRLEPTNHEAWMNLGFVLKMEGSLLKAADCFQAAYELEQSSPVDNFE